jgi:hypothetical protein
MMKKGTEKSNKTALLDDLLMPCVLSMAKYHVEAISCMHQVCVSSATDKSQASAEVKQLQSQHAQELTDLRSKNTDLSNLITFSNKKLNQFESQNASLNFEKDHIQQ